MTDAPTPQPARRPGFDDLLGDLFGLNVAGLRSVWTLFAAPRRYFDAARLPDWGHAFTPSVRLWLSLTALTVLLRFLWAQEDGRIAESYAGIWFDFREGLDMESARALGAATLNWILIVTPFVGLLTLSAVSLLFPLWGKGVKGTERVRFGFATIIPGAVLAIPLLPLFPHLTSMDPRVAWLIVLGPSLVFDVSTAARGAFAGQPIAARIAKALVFACVVGPAAYVSSYITQFIAFAIVGYSNPA